MASFSERFRKAFDLIAPTFSRKHLPEFEKLVDQLDDQEKDLIMFMAVAFQIPAVSMRALDYFAKRYKISIENLLEALPNSFYDKFFELLPSMVFIGVNLFSKLALVCSYELPMRVITKFAKTVLNMEKCHQMQPIFHELARRDISIVELLVDEYQPNGQAEKALSNILSWIACPSMKFESLCRVAILFLSGKAPMRSPLFDSFGLYVTIHIAKKSLLGANSDVTMMNVFEFLDKSLQEFHKKTLAKVRESLGEFPLPYIAFSLFFNDFTPAEKKKAMKSLISPRSSIKSFLVVSESLDQEYLRGLYSLSLSAKLSVYQIFKQTISFVPRVVESLSAVHYPYPIILKVFEIASYSEFEKMAFKVLKSIGRFCSLALVARHVLKVFTTREKKRIVSLIANYGGRQIDIVTSMYLIGVSKLVSGPRLKGRYRSLLKAVLGKLAISEMDASKPMPPDLKAFFAKKPKSIGALTTFLENAKLENDLFDIDKALSDIDKFVVPKVDTHPPSNASPAPPPKPSPPKSPVAPKPVPKPKNVPEKPVQKLPPRAVTRSTSLIQTKSPLATPEAPPSKAEKPPVPQKPSETKPSLVASPRATPVKQQRQVRSVPIVSELSDDDSFEHIEMPSEDYSAGKTESADSMYDYSGYEDVVLSDEGITQFAQMFRPSPTH